MPEIEDIHRDFLPRFIQAQRAFHDGDPEPNIALWSTQEPVTLFAVRGMRESGADALSATFRRAAQWFSNLTESRSTPTSRADVQVSSRTTPRRASVLRRKFVAYIGGSRCTSARRWSAPRTGCTRPDQQRR